MKAILHFAICIFTMCILCGCSQAYRWSQSHPSYNKAPTDSIAVTGLDEAFVVTRSSWFAKKLEISKDSIQTFTSNYCSKAFLDELKKSYKSVTVLPDAAFSHFPEESQKLDTRIFMKGHLPEQGIVVKDSSGNAPPYILIIHEFILGTDLQRENFYDYALIHNEAPEKKTSQNLSAIVSYTLWDNEKQRPLYSAVNQVDQPNVKLTLADISRIVASSVQQLKQNLTAGVK